MTGDYPPPPRGGVCEHCGKFRPIYRFDGPEPTPGYCFECLMALGAVAQRDAVERQVSEWLRSNKRITRRLFL